MTDRSETETGERSERDRRLASALRDNLHRRKAQARARAEGGAAEGGAPEADPPTSPGAPREP